MTRTQNEMRRRTASLPRTVLEDLLILGLHSLGVIPGLRSHGVLIGPGPTGEKIIRSRSWRVSVLLLILDSGESECVHYAYFLFMIVD